MDYVGGGDLFALIQWKEQLPEAWVRTYSAQIVLALEHIHSFNVIFRDLKPGNCEE